MLGSFNRMMLTPDNVWIGTSVENQAYAEDRIPELVKVPAKVRFLSVEPLLGPVDITSWLKGISWVIVGGESGPPNARPMHIDWVRSLRDQCQAAGVAFFFKQFGKNPNQTLTAELSDGAKMHRIIPLCDRRTGKQLRDVKGGNMEEWAEDLRIRQFPGGVANE